ncbi:MAG: hypothetical protein WC438_05250 [Candidatus Pacearchaeota archaeon]
MEKRKKTLDDEPIRVYPAVRPPLIKGVGENKVALEYFRKFVTHGEVTRKLYPNTKKDVKSIGAVTKVFDKLKRADYIEEGTEAINKTNFNGTRYTQRNSVHRIKIKFIFDSFDELHIKLTQKEKKFLNEIYDNPEARQVICELNAGENIFISAIKFYVLYYIIKQKGRPDDFKKKLDEKMIKLFEMPRIL